MNSQRRCVNAGLALWCTGLLLPAATQAQTPPQPSQLVFGLISPRAEQETRANWTPFVKRLGVAVSRPFELRVYASQGELVKAFLAGEIDLAWMGNVPALEVVTASAGSVFAQMVTKEGSVGYKSVLVVHRDAQVHALQAVIDKAASLRFGDGDPQSTSGHLVPLYFAFHKNGVNSPVAIFKSVEVGNHQQNLQKVAKKAVDVATANSEELLFFQRDFPALAKDVKVIWESPLIPQSPLLWKATLPEALKKSIQKFVVDFGASNPEEKRILLSVNGLSRFRASSNRQLVPIADLEMFKTRQAINNDTSLSANDRQARIGQAIDKGSRLELRLKLIP
ncbi:MAG: phosphate/phosphite/phosphonate ABC transporter substrate-binding protein [Pseudomonadota bacterium]